MITTIEMLRSGPGHVISFSAMADAEGANETVSVTIGGRRYATQVKIGPLEIVTYSIAHNETGRQVVSLAAESSNVSSKRLLDLDDPTNVLG